VYGGKNHLVLNSVEMLDIVTGWQTLTSVLFSGDMWFASVACANNVTHDHFTSPSNHTLTVAAITVGALMFVIVVFTLVYMLYRYRHTKIQRNRVRQRSMLINLNTMRMLTSNELAKR
jgi:heme/copper-type cytochrome/quinol oxidase subunit 2